MYRCAEIEGIRTAVLFDILSLGILAELPTPRTEYGLLMLKEPCKQNCLKKKKKSKDIAQAQTDSPISEIASPVCILI
jgi:hypothetical protein